MKNAVIVIVIVAVVFGLAAGIGLAFRDNAKKEEAPVATTPSTEQLQAQYQEDLQALRDSVTKFQNADTYASVDSIKTAFAQVQSNYEAAVSSGKKVKDAKISELSTAYNNLKDSINSISGGDQSLQQKVADVKAALNTFVEELKQI